jgi:murein DD-endopeptidase MepM/ murein hydrolase activator NlpD
LVFALSIALGAGAAVAQDLPTCLHPPVTAPVVGRFVAPRCRWCPGNRGLDYGTRLGTAVRAAAAGTVTFAGPVAGAVWVTVAHRGGMLTSYGPLRTLAVHRGDVVGSGEVVGTSAGMLHFGVRVAGTYIDPAPLLGVPVHLVPRLVPLHGRVPRPPALACPAGGRSVRVR